MQLSIAVKEIFRNTWLHPSYLDLRELKRGIKKASRYASGIVLDVGCGRKPYREYFSENVNKYIGIDMISSLYGRKLVDTYATVLALPFQSSSFNTLLCTEVLEHVPEPKIMLSEIERVLQPGGVLILTAPFCSPLHEAPRDYYRYTIYGLEQLIINEGFIIEYIKPRGDNWTVIGYLLSSWIGSPVLNYIITGKLMRSILLAILLLPICAVIQLFFSGLTAVFHNYRSTLGYIVLAHKKT